MTQNVQMRIMRNVRSHVYIKAGRLIVKTLIMQLVLTCFHTFVGVFSKFSMMNTFFCNQIL